MVPTANSAERGWKMISGYLTEAIKGLIATPVLL